jgi:hypothetical protein
MTGWEALGGVAFLAAGLAVTCRIMKSGFGPAQVQLERWASTQGFELVSASPRLFWRGPFFFASGMQKVFRIVARDGEGVVKRGWIRFGWALSSWTSGLEEKVVVKWD